MNNPTPTKNPPETTQTTPLRCFTGALMAGTLTSALYALTTSIAGSFAAKPLHSANPTVLNIGIAVRTLVVGVSTLATFVFGLVAVGLVALGIQLLIQQLIKRPNSDA